MSLFQALVLALLQGVTELFPVSSLGHTVILPKLLGWNLNQADPTFLAFVVLLHVGTATALLIYFWRDWWLLLSSLLPGSFEVRLRPVRPTELFSVSVLAAGVETNAVSATPVTVMVAVWVTGVLMLPPTSASSNFKKGRAGQDRVEVSRLSPDRLQEP